MIFCFSMGIRLMTGNEINEETWLRAVYNSIEQPLDKRIDHQNSINIIWKIIADYLENGNEYLLNTRN